jgi:hypothetical protein
MIDSEHVAALPVRLRDDDITRLNRECRYSMFQGQLIDRRSGNGVRETGAEIDAQRKKLKADVQAIATDKKRLEPKLFEAADQVSRARRSVYVAFYLAHD